MDLNWFEELERRIPKGGVRTRFAPSPTGYMHVGNLRTALYTWLIARHNQGTFILRIEDTDLKRKVDGAVEAVIAALDYFDIRFDEGAEIGGDDTYRLLPWLFDHNELAEAVTEKIFLGFSDTTVNHLMLHKVGLSTFYGQAFLPDVCEPDREMLPYTRRCLEELLETGAIRQIRPSDVWYEARRDFSQAALGTTMPAHPNGGFQLLQGPPVFSGEILGGCLDTLYDLFDNGRYADSVFVCGACCRIACRHTFI